RPGNVRGHGDEELLEDLDAEAADARVPQLRKECFGGCLLAAGGSVIGVDEDVGVDEFSPALSAHEAGRVSTSAGPGCRAIEPPSSLRGRAFAPPNSGDLHQPD